MKRHSLGYTSGILLLCASSIAAQSSAADDVAAGRKSFKKACTACHGAEAKGGRAPDLTSGEWRRGGSDDEILQNILSGIPNSEMPAFAMPVHEGRQIVAYLRSLRHEAPEEAVTGDAIAGRALFFGSAKCS